MNTPARWDSSTFICTDNFHNATPNSPDGETSLQHIRATLLHCRGRQFYYNGINVSRPSRSGVFPAVPCFG